MSFLARKSSGEAISIETDHADAKTIDDFIQTWGASYVFNLVTKDNWHYSMFEWDKIIIAFDAADNHEVFSAYGEGRLQGLLALDHTAGTEISYIATAPWNYERGSERIEKIGTGLICLAIDRSIKAGNKGTLTLYSVPDAVSFYEKAIGMKLTGNKKGDLIGFALDEKQAIVVKKKFG